MPLNVLLGAIGSMGDVHPVIALGTALRARGHRVSTATIQRVLREHAPQEQVA